MADLHCVQCNTKVSKDDHYCKCCGKKLEGAVVDFDEVEEPEYDPDLERCLEDMLHHTDWDF